MNSSKEITGAYKEYVKKELAELYDRLVLEGEGQGLTNDEAGKIIIEVVSGY